MFTQYWPQSYCYLLTKRNPNNECSISENNHWLIHGIWAQKNNRSHPFYCKNNTFSESQLAPILPDLRAKWSFIKKGASSSELWQHEWDKHGTCAVHVESMDSEIKYFKKGLELYHKFNITEILQDSQIEPGQYANIYSYIEAVKKFTGKNCDIECFHNNVSFRIIIDDLSINNITDNFFTLLPLM